MPTEAWKQLINCGATPSKDHSIWTFSAVSEEDVSAVDEVLTQCLKIIDNWKIQSWWSNDWSVSIWATVSSPREFVGLVIPVQVSMYASSIGVDLIFSVYCAQEEEDCETPDKKPDA
jgi:hypothetical protein